ncbi:hypothetical protein C4K01_2416 [Pseudomonas synxantha]|uniref:Uncharacterized protein n=1 Tax=Pseudomonas synxantha TaxID=47883 RepID=A0AAU8TUQ9_9PSED|nr:hypothetical protein VO64_5524 [Pseudomonas synxantha]AZE66611.1 hypothetical protein C4K01_2416 [Pseudomonas synxantha]
MLVILIVATTPIESFLPRIRLPEAGQAAAVVGDNAGH